MNDRLICEGCGEELAPGTTICVLCGRDHRADLVAPPRPSILAQLRAGGWRLVVYGLIILLPILGFMRLRTTGPGPDLSTTLRWMVFGDGGRAAELETIHRMYEIATAASRYSIREQEMPSFEGDWEKILAPAATARIRGWMPLVFFGADTAMSPASVREMYEVRSVDGWGRLYRVNMRPLVRGLSALDDPQVAADFDQGLQATFFTLDKPDLEHGQWVRVEIESAGSDGDFDTGDDLRMVSYILVGHVFRLLYDPDEVQRRIERAYTIGRHYFRIEGSDYDLIDARLLAEYRLTSIY
jgi:hypothetical protein